MGLKDKILEHFPKKSKKVTVSPKTEIPNNRKPEKDLVKDIPVIDSSAKDKSGESSSISLSPNHKASENDLLSKQTHSYQTLKEVKENTKSERDSQKKALDTAKELPVKISESESQCDETVNKDSNEESSDFSNMNQTDTTVVSSSDTQTDSNTETEKEGGLNPTTPTENSTAQNQSDDNNIITDEGFENESALRMDSNLRPDVDNPISADLEINNEEKSDQDDVDSTENSRNSKSTIDTLSHAEDDFSETKSSQDYENHFEEMETVPLTDDMWGEKDGRYYFGKPQGSFEQTPYPSKRSNKNRYHKYDLVADIAQFNYLMVLGSSIRGESHYAYESVRQDSFSIDEFYHDSKHYVFCAIADGVGGSPYSDELADYLVNNISFELKKIIEQNNGLKEIDWYEVSDLIWKLGLSFCQSKDNETFNEKNLSDKIREHLKKWATTLEFVLICDNDNYSNMFVHVTICGDGGSYLIDDAGWRVIKNGKIIKNNFVSNGVVALPNQPQKLLIRYGQLNNNESLFIVTDGLSDIIEESSEYRAFIGKKLCKVNNLPEYIKTICTTFNQMDDDKTGLLIKYHKRE